MARLSRRIVFRAPLALGALGALVAAGTAAAFIRLTDLSGGPIRWGSQPVAYVIHASGSDDLAGDERDDVAIRLAFEAWGALPTSTLRFVEDATPARRNGSKAHANDAVNLVFFDETNATGFFSGNSYIIALTPIFFDGSGNIRDADIVFNGRDHTFSTDLRAGTYDIQNVATHEVGHLAGLDHTGVYGATLVPFAFEQETRLRSISNDERAAVESIYPGPGAPGGRILGRVLFDGGGAVRGAHVVATDAATGEPRASAVTNANGDFALSALPGGSYWVLVEPLDGPTADANLQLDGIDADFTTSFYGGIASRATLSLPDGGLVDLRAQPLRVRGRTGFNIDGVSGGRAQVRRGTTVTIQLTGSGLVNGLEVEVPGPGLRLSLDDPNRTRLGSGGAFQATADANAPVGLRDIYVYRGAGANREMVALPGGLEIVAAAPHVLGAIPTSGPSAGGEQVTISGAGFQPGARVLFGDGLAPQVTFVSDTALVATTPPHAVGSVAVTVINPDGQQDVRPSTYTFTGNPQLSGVSPAQGPSAGGAPVALFGSQFAAGAQVFFDTAAASGVVVSDGGRRIDCVAPGGALGPVDVTVRNPDGAADTLTNGYTYIAPRLDSIAPSSGSEAGGTTVALKGDGLSPNMTVLFGRNHASGVQFVSQAEIRASTPAGSGTVDVTVLATDGLSDSLPDAFRYVAGNDPVVSAIFPASGPASGGTDVIVFGNNFEAGARLFIGANEARDVLVLSTTEIRARTPAGAAGPADVRVVNPSTLTGTLYGGFTYLVGGGTSGSSGSRSGGGGGGGCAARPAGAAGAAGFPALLPHLLGLAALAIIRRRVRAGSPPRAGRD